MRISVPSFRQARSLSHSAPWWRTTGDSSQHCAVIVPEEREVGADRHDNGMSSASIFAILSHMSRLKKRHSADNGSLFRIKYRFIPVISMTPFIPACGIRGKYLRRRRPVSFSYSSLDIAPVGSSPASLTQSYRRLRYSSTSAAAITPQPQLRIVAFSDLP